MVKLSEGRGVCREGMGGLSIWSVEEVVRR